jgi:hypothetical protein
LPHAYRIGDLKLFEATAILFLVTPRDGESAADGGLSDHPALRTAYVLILLHARLPSFTLLGF